MTDGLTGYWERKRLTRRSALRSAGFVGTGLAGAALVGCGSGDDDDDDDDGGDEPAPGAQPTATKTPKLGGKLRWGSTGDINPATMPTYQSVTSSFPLQHAVTDYLMKYSGLSIEASKVKGHVAEKWEQTSPLDMTITLRPGVKWHDDTPVTAQDIVFNFQKIIGSRSAVESLSSRVTPTAVNETTISLKFAKPLPSIFDLINYMYLNQPKNFDKLAKGEAIIGSGPFMFKDWTPGTKTTIVKNPNYWQKGKPYLDEIEYHILPAANLATTMEAGGIDYSLSLNVSEAQRLGKQDQFRLNPGSPGFAFQFVNTNTQHPALLDKRDHQGPQQGEEPSFGSWVQQLDRGRASAQLQRRRDSRGHHDDPSERPEGHRHEDEAGSCRCRHCHQARHSAVLVARPVHRSPGLRGHVPDDLPPGNGPDQAAELPAIQPVRIPGVPG
jgi:peptide/nickel transport system substrate-binding protein